MLARPVFKWATHVGSSIVWSMEFAWMVPWIPIPKHNQRLTIHSRPFSPKLDLESMFHVLSLWISSQGQYKLHFTFHNLTLILVWSMKFAPAVTRSSSTRSKWSPVKRMRPTTMPVATTQLARSWLIMCWTESANYPTTARVFKDSWFSTHLAAELVLVSLHFWWSAYRSTTAKRYFFKFQNSSLILNSG